MDLRPNRGNKAALSSSERGLRFVFFVFWVFCSVYYHSLEKKLGLSRYSCEPAHVTKYDVI